MAGAAAAARGEVRPPMVDPLNLTPEATGCGPALWGMPRSGDELKLTPPRARWDGVPAWAEAEDDSEVEEEEDEEDDEGGQAAEDADEREEGSRLSFCVFGCVRVCGGARRA
jgi:hypothetical protein